MKNIFENERKLSSPAKIFSLLKIIAAINYFRANIGVILLLHLLPEANVWNLVFYCPVKYMVTGTTDSRIYFRMPLLIHFHYP